MKILIASGVAHTREAGTSGLVLEQAEELRKLGHIVDCWFYEDVVQKPRWPGRLRDLEFAYHLSKRIRNHPGQYDVVNLLAPWGGVYGLSRKLRPSRPLPPYIFTMQGSEERYALVMRAEDRKGRATHFRWKNRVWHRLYHQTMYDLAIATADYGAVACREGWTHSELKYHFLPGRLWYVPNGAAQAFFQTRNYRQGIATRLLFAGTWLDRKGIYYLVDGFAELAPRIPGLTLTVAGCQINEEQIRAFFPEQIRARVSVVPFVSREAMPAIYLEHDILVLPSLIEGMPLTLLEAMATGMPVVTTNTCGMADVVEDGFNGLLVPPANGTALAEATQRLCESADLREKLGRAAQDTARRYTWETIAHRMAAIFELAIHSRHGRARVP